MEAETPMRVPEPEIRAPQLWFLRILAAACALLILWGARESGLVVALIYSLPYLLGAWWLRPGTMRRGVAIVALTGTVVGFLARHHTLRGQAFSTSTFLDVSLRPGECRGGFCVRTDFGIRPR